MCDVYSYYLWYDCAIPFDPEGHSGRLFLLSDGDWQQKYIIIIKNLNEGKIERNTHNLNKKKLQFVFSWKKNIKKIYL